MSALGAKLREVSWKGNRGLMFWCPGCDKPHTVNIEGTSAWTWDGNRDAPTFDPSILAWTNVGEDGKRLPEGQQRTLCHSFVRGGSIEFLADSAHALAGQTVPLPDWPDSER